MESKSQTAAPAALPALPAVVLVMVTHEPGDWFDQVLTGIADQEYEGLSVLFIDTDSAETPAERIAAVLPNAFVRRLDDDPGFGPSANLALDMVEGAAFFLFCHDDVRLRPGALRAMVEEAFRSNAAVVAPKVLSWEDPEQIISVGMTTDKFAAPASYVEPGELDQEQHDAVRDVLFAPGGCTLVRADLFAEIGGFDPGIDFVGEALSLCWRAHLAGARVLVAPSAEVLHRESLEQRDAGDRQHQQFRHRIRNVLSYYSRWSLVRIVPQMVLLSLFEASYSLVVGRVGVARNISRSWRWNLSRLSEIRANRARVARLRRVPDREVRSLQIRGSARLQAFTRGQIGRGDDRLAALRARGAGIASTLSDTSTRVVAIVLATVAFVFVLGSRQLITDGVAAYGEFAAFPADPWLLLREFLSDFQGSGVGAAGVPPTAFGLIGLSGVGFFAQMGLLRTVLLLGLFPVAAFGVWKAARLLGMGRPPAAVSVVVALALPLPYNALANGSWSGLLVWAFVPYLIIWLIRSADSQRSAPRVEGVALVVFVVAAFVPLALVVIPVLVGLVLLGSVLIRQVPSPRQFAGPVLIGAAIGAMLNLPWFFGLATNGFTWASVAGTRMGGPIGAAELLKFETGPHGAGPLGWALPLAALAAPLVARAWRLTWSIRLLTVATGFWVWAAAAEADLFEVAMPRPEVLLAPAAISVALVAGLGASAYTFDLASARFGWRQLAVGAAAVLVVVGTLPWFAASIDGSWDTPSDRASARLVFLDEPADQDAEPGGWGRNVWIGRSDDLPVAGWPLGDLAWGINDKGGPTTRDRFVDEDAPTRTIGDALADVTAGRTQRLGRLLIPSGTRYVIVALEGVDGTPVDDPTLDLLVARLDEQLDLERLRIADSIAVYRNRAWVPVVASVPEGETPENRGFESSLAYPVEEPEAVLAIDQPAGTIRFQDDGEAAEEVLVGFGDPEGWTLRADGEAVEGQMAFGWAASYPVDAVGELTLTRNRSWLRLGLLVLQLVALAVITVRTVRRPDGRRHEAAT